MDSFFDPKHHAIVLFPIKFRGNMSKSDEPLKTQTHDERTTI